MFQGTGIWKLIYPITIKWRFFQILAIFVKSEFCLANTFQLYKYQVIFWTRSFRQKESYEAIFVSRLLGQYVSRLVGQLLVSLSNGSYFSEILHEVRGS